MCPDDATDQGITDLILDLHIIDDGAASAAELQKACK